MFVLRRDGEGGIGGLWCLCLTSVCCPLQVDLKMKYLDDGQHQKVCLCCSLKEIFF